MRILMLHGYAQTGDIFRRKTRRLVDEIRDAHPRATFVWPDGPIRLRTSDIPGFNAGEYDGLADEIVELRAWFHLRDVSEPPLGLLDSLTATAHILQSEGPFDGVVAFSQGTVIAGMVASLLEGVERWQAHCTASHRSTKLMEYPPIFRTLQHPPFKFGVMYAGRVGRGRYFDWLYENPRISTPFCVLWGKWDPMVDADERDAAWSRFSTEQGSCMLIHNGGHYVPTDTESTEYVSGFIVSATDRKQQAIQLGTTAIGIESTPIDPYALTERLVALSLSLGMGRRVIVREEKAFTKDTHCAALDRSPV